MTADLNTQSAPGAKRGDISAILGVSWMFIKAVSPFAIGLGVAWLLIHFAYSETGPDFTRSVLHRDPFKGSVYIHAIFISSIVVTIVATVFYLGELSRCRDLLVGRPGRASVIVAYWLTIAALALPLVAMLTAFALPESAHSLYELCTYGRVGHDLVLHYVLVGAIFAAFLVIDILTYMGLNRALPTTTGEVGLDIENQRNFALAQICYVDLPVLIGGLLTWVIFFAPQALTPAHMAMDSEIFSLGAGGTACGEVTMPKPMFDSMMSNLFLGSLTAGYLAAHVIMSQLVFVILSVVSHFDREKARAGRNSATAGHNK